MSRWRARHLLVSGTMTENATPQAARPRFGSIVDRETSRLTQLLGHSHTTIIRGLSLLAPRQRRARVRWIFAAGILAVVGLLAMDRSAREFVTSKGHDFFRTQSASAAAEPARAPEPAALSAPATTAVAQPTAGRQAAAVASATAEPASTKEDVPSISVQPTSTRTNRTPKARGTARPRATSSRGGT